MAENIIKPAHTYNRAKTWQMGCFVLNNAATNLYMFGMGYVSYYVVGIAGLSVAVISVILTSMRIWDGFTDPVIGYWIDKTDGKFGKFRPFMIAGNIILAVFMILIFKTTHLVPESFRLIYFVLLYGLYIIGYTFQTACTKSGQACLTNDPKQRPTFTLFDSIYNAILMTGLMVVVTSYLVPKFGGFTTELFDVLLIIVIGGSAVMTALAVAGIWEKDRTEFFGLGAKAVKTRFRDYWPVLKGNRAIQMLIFAASSDKLALSIAGNASILIMLYGIVMGNYALAGSIGMITLVPNFIIVFFGIQYARKLGQKKAVVLSTWLCIIFSLMLLALLALGDPTQINLSNLGFMTVGFIVLLILQKGATSISGGIVIPMIADCADYETYQSGRFVPGMMGTLFSFVDKLISSLATTIVGLILVSIGYATTLPQPTDASSPTIFWITMFLFIGMPIIGWVCTLIAMKFYPLTQEKMAVIQDRIAEIKAESAE